MTLIIERPQTVRGGLSRRGWIGSLRVPGSYSGCSVLPLTGSGRCGFLAPMLRALVLCVVEAGVAVGCQIGPEVLLNSDAVTETIIVLVTYRQRPIP